MLERLLPAACLVLLLATIPASAAPAEVWLTAEDGVKVDVISANDLPGVVFEDYDVVAMLNVPAMLGMLDLSLLFYLGIFYLIAHFVIASLLAAWQTPASLTLFWFAVAFAILGISFAIGAWRFSLLLTGADVVVPWRSLFRAYLVAGFFNLGAGLFGPLFNSGENQRRVDAEVARTTQLLNRYEQSILNAYREVEDALVAVRTFRAELDARLREVRAAESAAELSWIRYEDGVTSYLEVLETQRALFTSQLATSQTRQLALTSVVELYAALGGGWQVREDPVPAGP